MARTPTTNQGFSKAGDSQDLYSYTEDHFNLLTRLDAALAGIASYDVGGNRVNANSGNAGKILGAHGASGRGRVIGLAAGNDGHLIFQDNDGALGVDKFAYGYDDSADALVTSPGASLTTTGHYLTTAGVFGTYGNLEVRQHQLQMFRVTIKNNGGTIQIRIAGPDDSTGSNLANKIVGASSSFTNLNDQASVDAFSAGGILLNGSPHILILNTAAPTIADCGAQVSMSYNKTGTALTVLPFISSRTVGGVTLSRLELQFFNATSAASFALNTTNITSGNEIRVSALATLK